MKELDDYDYGLCEEKKRLFLDRVTPKLEELGAVIKGYIANGRPGHDRKKLAQLSKKLETLIPIYRELSWYSRDDLLEGIEIRAAADLLDEKLDLQTRRHENVPLGWNEPKAIKNGEVSFGVPVDDSLTFILSVIQRRAQAESKVDHRRHCGHSAVDEAKDAYAVEFVEIVCREWLGGFEPLVSNKGTTVVDVVEFLFRYYTGKRIGGKQHVSEWLKGAN